MGSSRLPGKSLAPVGQVPMLQVMLDRVGRARRLDGIVVATSTLERDDAIASIAAAAGVEVFRGDEQDVLSRYAGAAATAGAETVVRLTADCPLIDPAVIDRVVDEYARGGADIASNNAPPVSARTYPDGMDAEAFSRAALERAHAEAVEPPHREHVTPYVYATGRVRRVDLPENRGDVRITVDHQDDLDLVREIVGAVGTDASLDEILAYLDAR